MLNACGAHCENCDVIAEVINALKTEIPGANTCTGDLFILACVAHSALSLQRSAFSVISLRSLYLLP